MPTLYPGLLVLRTNGARPNVDSPLEGAGRSEPVSEISPFRAILDGNKLILALKIAQNRKHGSRSA